MKKISFVLPCYNEEENIQVMVDRIDAVGRKLTGYDYEIIFVDDHSADRSALVLRSVAENNSRLRFARFARRTGSHGAASYGLKMATGDCAIILAADGQDPPEFAENMVARWQENFEIVWGARSIYKRSFIDSLFSKSYYWLMNHFSEVEMHAQGADMVLLDRRVLDVLNTTSERNSSLWALIGWLGFNQATLHYNKAERSSGKTGWSTFMKVKVTIDSFVAFSYAPIRFCSYMGLSLSGLSFAIGSVYLLNVLTGGLILGPAEAPGWASLFVLILFVSGLQMLMLGILGEYLWRGLDEIRRRPTHVIEFEYPPATGDRK